jgi:hypothetical protein
MRIRMAGFHRHVFGCLIGAAVAGAAPAAAPCPTCVPPGPPVSVPAQVRRDVSPVVFQAVVDGEVAQATVTILLGDATMNAVMLDYRNRAVPFDVSAGPCRASGTLFLRLNETPSVSALYLDAVIEGPEDGASCRNGAPAPANPPAARAFRGDLLLWRNPLKPVLLRDRRPVAADLVVQVDVVPGQAGKIQAANITFLYGGQLMWSVPVTHGNPVTVNQDVTAGQAVIRKGAVFTLTLPSEVSDGAVQARNLQLVSGAASVDASGILASWPPPPAGPPPGLPQPSPP